MSRTILQSIRELCLEFPDTQETRSHGTPTFKVSGKTFVYLTLNHHGDGRAAIWVGSPEGVQQEMVNQNSEAYFVPPYVGVRGWLGVDLDKGLPWNEIFQRVREAYINLAPGNVSLLINEHTTIAAPDKSLRPEDINPMLGKRSQTVLAGIARLCRKLPETSPADASSSLIWKAGKKTFVRGHHIDGRLKLLFWVGIEQQGFMLEDPRFTLPMYIASSGWIELDVQDNINWDEIESLLLNSYRHFALKRMLKALAC
jgi:hypothetical protein